MRHIVRLNQQLNQLIQSTNQLTNQPTNGLPRLPAWCASQFMEMNEEEFAKFLQTFVTDVWGLLLKVTLASGQVSEGR